MAFYESFIHQEYLTTKNDKFINFVNMKDLVYKQIVLRQKKGYETGYELKGSDRS